MARATVSSETISYFRVNMGGCAATRRAFLGASRGLSVAAHPILSMELCILKFSGADTAEDAFEAALLCTRSWFTWLNDVSVVSRSRFGLMTIAPSRSDQDIDLFDCDDADMPDLAASEMDVHTRFLVGPFASPAWYSAAPPIEEAVLDPLELSKELLHRGALKDLLPPDSSALLLVSDPETCGAMIDLFAARHPSILCRDLGSLYRPRLAG